MSALDVANNLMDSEHQTEIVVKGQRQFQENVLKNQISGDSTRTEMHEGTGTLTSGKELHSIVSEGKIAVKKQCIAL